MSLELKIRSGSRKPGERSRGNPKGRQCGVGAEGQHHGRKARGHGGCATVRVWRGGSVRFRWCTVHTSLGCGEWISLRRACCSAAAALRMVAAAEGSPLQSAAGPSIDDGRPSGVDGAACGHRGSARRGPGRRYNKRVRERGRGACLGIQGTQKLMQ
jgi:hypothetical protein